MRGGKTTGHCTSAAAATYAVAATCSAANAVATNALSAAATFAAALSANACSSNAFSFLSSRFNRLILALFDLPFEVNCSSVCEILEVTFLCGYSSLKINLA